MRATIVAVLLTAALSGAAETQQFVGLISDDVCPKGDHSQMQMGPTAADCAAACVSAHGAVYVLYDGKTAYRLIGGPPLEQFAGKKVRVVGSLNAKTQTINVESISLTTGRE